MLAGSLRVAEHACAFHDDITAEVAPRKGCRIALGAHGNGLAVDHELTAFDAHLTREAAVDAVVLEQVGQRVHAGQVIDGNNFHAVFGEELAEGQTADAAESVDGNLGHGVGFAFRC